jgi:tetratricopeptide (TPR) repeat protein
VHHGCRAGLYDEAYSIFINRVENTGPVVLGERRYALLGGEPTALSGRLGRTDLALEISREFFPSGDFSRNPTLSDSALQGFLIFNTGVRLARLGQLDAAKSLYWRGIRCLEEGELRWELAQAYSGASTLYADLGWLKAAGKAARQASSLVEEDDIEPEYFQVYAAEAWIAHLRGDLAEASEAFEAAQQWSQAIWASVPWMPSARCLDQAEHLGRTGDRETARSIAQFTLNHWKNRASLSDRSRCHRLLGDQEAAEMIWDSALACYEEAVATATRGADRKALIESLVARGRCRARGFKDPDPAIDDLTQALGMAREGGYRLMEVDCRVALGWAQVAAGKLLLAQVQAERARKDSEAIGYYWGKREASELQCAMVGNGGPLLDV